ncbi:MAG: insulinase family protein [Bdellovibrionales bacterium]|nr:insulinase family protein [Oligoflexia bacterium]
MQKFSPLVLVGVILFASSCTHAPVRPVVHQPGAADHEGRFEVVQLTPNFKAKRAVLSNGLKLIVVSDPSSPTFAYQTWFNVGSRNEAQGKTGLAHLFEHLMFKGTKTHKEGEFDSLLERAGAEGENAYTTNDHTVYLQEMPKASLDLIVNLEADRMVNLIVDDNSFKTERDVVQNERRFRKENSAEGTIYQTMFETAFTTGAYHWPVIGYEQDLNLMNAQDARNFYQTYYSPERAMIVIVGDVNADDVYQKVEKAYGTIPSKAAVENTIPSEPDQSAQRRKRLSLNVEVEKLWLGFKVPAANSPDAAVLDAIQGVLSEGKNSRLNRALVDSGISGSVGAGSLGLKDAGLFLLETDLQKGKTSLLAEQVILRELERLKTNPVSADELKRALNIMRFRFFEKLATGPGKANYIGSAESQLGSLEAGLAQEKQLSQVTPEQIMQVTQRYFDTSKLTVVVAVPKKSK